MNGAIIYRWGPSVRGREQQALEVFAEAVAYWDNLVKNGRVSSHEPFFSTIRDGGYWIMKGDLDELNAIVQEKDYQRLALKVQMFVEDWSMETCVGGSIEDVGMQVSLLQEVAAELF